MSFRDSYIRVLWVFFSHLLGKKCFQNDSIHFSLGNSLHILVWDFYVVVIGPKYARDEAQVLECDLGSFSCQSC